MKGMQVPGMFCMAEHAVFKVRGSTPTIGPCLDEKQGKQGAFLDVSRNESGDSCQGVKG